MGNVSCHPREKPSDDAELVVQNVQNDNPMHFRNIPVPVEILPPLPELHDFKGDASRGVGMARMARALYEDPDFPATDGSIGGVTGDHANPNAAKYLQEMMKLIVPGWVRPAEMIGKKAGKYELWGTEGEPCLFNRVSPYDIKQGYLGDCWLVSAMSTLAEYPDHVRRLFKQKTLSEDGRYDVRLYDPTAEEWKLVTIDDRLPYWQRPGKHGNLCFAAPTPQNEFWPCLLEKAVAKFVMGFYRLDRGWESTAQEMLTGKPSVCMVLDPMPNGYHSPFHIITGKTPWTARHATVYMRKETFDLQYRYYGADASSLVGGKTRFTDEEMWSIVKEWDDKGYCQSCGSRTNYKGILAGHAYTVLRLVDVPITRKDRHGGEVDFVLKLLHVRNPHGTNEWVGRFNDMDWETWHAFPEALKATGHKVGTKDDGAFWMDWEDFKEGFRDISVAFTAENKGARYTDDSAAAINQHHNVEFGMIGYQRWEGMR